MSFVGGIDLGGTKIEARLFDQDWHVLQTRRILTPTDDYSNLLDGLADQIAWLRAEASAPLLPIGVGAPGLVNPTTGLALTANLPASGRPLPKDLAARVGQSIPFINDCRAFALSEAVFGAGKDDRAVAGLVIGTGVAGGMVVDKLPLPTLNGMGGEIGHVPIPYPVMKRLDLPERVCGCGRTACFETVLAGPGLSALAVHMTGAQLTGEGFAKLIRSGDRDARAIYATWLDVATALIDMIMMTYDPDRIVLGGGLSLLPDLTDELSKRTKAQALPGTIVPALSLAEGGDSSGARGAAWFARQVSGDVPEKAGVA